LAGFWTGEIVVDDKDLIGAYLELIEEMPEVVRTITGQVVNKVGDKYLAKLQTEPGKVKYPIKWKSEKQRRAFFATNGFGKGIPTRRNHKLVQGWKLVVTYLPDAIAQVAFTNPVSYRRYVTGRDQQPFHAITGWYYEENIFLDAAIEMADGVLDGLIRSFYAVEG
jgi:hypothetical protein